MASSEVEAALCTRLDQIRLASNVTQSELAARAGVSRSTVARLASANKGISLDSFIRIAMALGLTENLETLLPDQSVRPLDRVREVAAPRQRARKSNTQTSKKWVWKDPDNKS